MFGVVSVVDLVVLCGLVGCGVIVVLFAAVFCRFDLMDFLGFGFWCYSGCCYTVAGCCLRWVMVADREFVF